jgi:hypothetical protein
MAMAYHEMVEAKSIRDHYGPKLEVLESRLTMKLGELWPLVGDHMVKTYPICKRLMEARCLEWKVDDITSKYAYAFPLEQQEAARAIQRRVDQVMEEVELALENNRGLVFPWPKGGMGEFCSSDESEDEEECGSQQDEVHSSEDEEESMSEEWKSQALRIATLIQQDHQERHQQKGVVRFTTCATQTCEVIAAPLEPLDNDGGDLPLSILQDSQPKCHDRDLELLRVELAKEQQQSKEREMELQAQLKSQAIFHDQELEGLRAELAMKEERKMAGFTTHATLAFSEVQVLLDSQAVAQEQLQAQDQELAQKLARERVEALNKRLILENEILKDALLLRAGKRVGGRRRIPLPPSLARGFNPDDQEHEIPDRPAINSSVGGAEDCINSALGAQTVPAINSSGGAKDCMKHLGVEVDIGLEMGSTGPTSIVGFETDCRSRVGPVGEAICIGGGLGGGSSRISGSCIGSGRVGHLSGNLVSRIGGSHISHLSGIHLGSARRIRSGGGHNCCGQASLRGNFRTGCETDGGKRKKLRTKKAKRKKKKRLPAVLVVSTRRRRKVIFRLWKYRRKLINADK